MRDVLVFDLDDTLFPEHEFVRSGFIAAGIWLQNRHGISGFAVAAQRIFDAGLRGTVFNASLEELSGVAPPDLVTDLVRVYREHAPTITLHPDAAWALKHYRRTFTLGLLTDGYLVTQRNKVRALGIAPLFETIIYSDVDGRAAWKPSPIPYQRLMERVGADVGSFTYVSDNPAKDFVMARELGWRTVRIVRLDGEYRAVAHATDHAADLTVDSLFDLEQVLG